MPQNLPRLVLLSVALAAAGAPILGCARTVTQAELAEKGTRDYPGQSAPAVLHAAATALKTLGFEVAVIDVARGRVKTAPKVVQVTAVGGRYAATSYSDGLAWSIDVAPVTGGSVMRARPRAYRNGVPLDETNITAAYMDKAFADLFAELEENLPGYVPPPEASSPTPPKAAGARPR